MQTSPYLRKATLWLLSSSNFSEEDLRFPSLSIIHEIVYRVFSFITLLALPPALIISWQRHQLVVMAVQALVGVTQVLHVTLLMKNNYRLLPPLLLVSISILLYILGVSRGEHSIMYWASAFPPAFYLLVEKRSARRMSVAWVILNVALAFMVFHTERPSQIIASLITTTLFVDALFSILNRHERHLEILATRDPLTGTYNRRRMIEDLDQAIAMYNRHGSNASIIIIDVDRFKSINDSYGHQEGDTVLRNLAGIVMERLRCSDRFYRYGGEEFVALLNETNLRLAAQVADEFRELIRSGNLSEKQMVTVSCGVSQTRKGDTVNNWISRADRALYKAKINGRDRSETEHIEAPEDGSVGAGSVGSPV